MTQAYRAACYMMRRAKANSSVLSHVYISILSKDIGIDPREIGQKIGLSYVPPFDFDENWHTYRVGWPRFNFFVSNFRSPHLCLMQFDTLISNIVSISQNSGKFCSSRPFECQFWPILTGFVILCAAQSPRWSSHLMRAKYCLFASFWPINHPFLSISLRAMTICISRFSSAMHSGSNGGYKYLNLFVTCNGCDHDNSASWDVHVKVHASDLASPSRVMLWYP